jgi:hypothetical protein
MSSISSNSEAIILESCRPVESRLLFIQDLKEKSEMKHKTFSE